MRIAITGSIATDHLMTFRVRFADSLAVEELDKISVSFLAETLDIRRGGIAANICFGVASLGQTPLLVGAAGLDFDDYREWLTSKGVDCTYVHTSSERHTARFVCTTDDDMAQMATFYAGAMSEASTIDLTPILTGDEGIDYVLIGANDPDAMARHTEQCREHGVPFIADPSQQLAFGDGGFIKTLIEGAEYLFTNEYEAHLTESKTGWSAKDIAERVRTRVITKGKDGAVVLTRGEEPIEVPIAAEVERVDPTGVGDAFRAGFLTGLGAGLSHRRCAEIGSLLATYVIETIGTQEYVVEKSSFLSRFEQSYGAAAAAEIAPHVASIR